MLAQFAQRFRKSTLPLRRRLLGDRAVITLNGRRIAISLADKRFTAQLYYRERVYEPGELALLHRVLRPGMTVLDVGANIGLYTLELAAGAAPGGRTIAFEPDPLNRALLEENCRRNHCTNVTIVAAAVGDAVGETLLYQSTVNFGDHRTYTAGDNDRYNAGHPRKSIPVPVVTIDEYAAEHNLDVDFIKSDIQGAEASLWRGMQQTIARRQNLQLFFEFWPYGIRACGDDPETLLQEMSGAGFSIYALEQGRLQQHQPAALVARLTGERFINILCSRTPVAADLLA